MDGVSIVKTETLEKLILKVEALENIVGSTIDIINNTQKQYLSPKDVMTLTGFSRDWVFDHQKEIGYTTVTGQVRIKKSDLEAFMSQNYFKVKTLSKKSA